MIRRLGMEVMILAPALAKSGMMRSTGLTMRLTSMGAVCTRPYRFADQRTDGQIGNVMIVHHVKVNPVRSGCNDVSTSLSQSGEIGRKVCWGR